MRDNRQFEQEYREWRKKESPDLWDRIESQLKEHPERGIISQELKEHSGSKIPNKEIAEQKALEKETPKRRQRRGRIYGMAMATAAAVVFVAVVPVMFRGVSPEEQLAGGNLAMETTAESQKNTWEEAEVVDSPEEGAAANDYEFLELGAGERLQVPEGAVTLPEDTGYFSEAILADTELLCTGTVESASLEYDPQGRAVKVIYRLQTGQIHYAQDYIDSREELLVESPIIEAEGDEVYVLYQLKQGNTYLLPLKKQEGDWELIYPFAPQIEITEEGGYLFHSGYVSLVNQKTEVVAGIREGENDYFYDRMLIRQDDEFLSQYLSMINREKGGES